MGVVLQVGGVSCLHPLQVGIQPDIQRCRVESRLLLCSLETREDAGYIVAEGVDGVAALHDEQGRQLR